MDLKSVGAVCFGTMSSLATIYSNTYEETWGRWHRIELDYLLDYLDIHWTYYFTVVESEESNGSQSEQSRCDSERRERESGDVEADN